MGGGKEGGRVGGGRGGGGGGGGGGEEGEGGGQRGIGSPGHEFFKLLGRVRQCHHFIIPSEHNVL